MPENKWTIDNEQIGSALRAAYADWANSHGVHARPVRLPASSQIEFTKSGPDLHIRMSGEAVSSNMQTNAGGFEGWAIALRLWLGFSKIVLHWSPPKREPDGPRKRHYARFLYRVQRFEELFPDWFHIGTSGLLEECAVRGGEELFLNVAGSISREPVDAKRETKIERALVGEHEGVLRAKLGLTAVDRQFPVGLYRSANLKGPVFTGGTSAIDIVGVDGDRFTLIELKAGKNIMVGALSELLFYAAVVRDAVSGRFSFGGNTGGPSRSKVGPTEATTAKRVRAVLMAEHFHPLLEHPDLIRTLNDAANRQGGSVPLTFEQWSLVFDGVKPPELERIAS